MRLVKGWANEVVHAGIGDDEGLGAVLFDEEDACEQRASLGDDEAAGLQQKVNLRVRE